MEAMTALGSFKDASALPQLIAYAQETSPARPDGGASLIMSEGRSSARLVRWPMPVPSRCSSMP
jgi:hypothetical protein